MLFVLIESHDVHGTVEFGKQGIVIDGRHVNVAIGQESVLAEVLNEEVLLHVRGSACQKVIEYVESSLFFGLSDGTRLLQQV